MFTLRLQPRPGIDAIKALRWLLKKAQRLGLKAIEVTEEEGGERTGKQHAGSGPVNQPPKAFTAFSTESESRGIGGFPKPLR